MIQKTWLQSRCLDMGGRSEFRYNPVLAALPIMSHKLSHFFGLIVFME
jgi:hypothetical protein